MARVTHLESMHKLRETPARSPPGMRAGGSLQMPSLKPSECCEHETQGSTTVAQTSWAPIHKLDCALSLDTSYSGLNILWYDVASVQQAAGH